MNKQKEIKEILMSTGCSVSVSMDLIEYLEKYLSKNKIKIVSACCGASVEMDFLGYFICNKCSEKCICVGKRCKKSVCMSNNPKSKEFKKLIGVLVKQGGIDIKRGTIKKI